MSDKQQSEAAMRAAEDAYFSRPDAGSTEEHLNHYRRALDAFAAERVKAETTRRKISAGTSTSSLPLAKRHWHTWGRLDRGSTSRTSPRARTRRSTARRCRMCDEHVDHWTHSEHTSRTWKKCSECDGLIAPGDRYVRIAIINDGSAETFNLHIPCDQLSAEVATDGSCRMLMPNSVIDWLAYGDCDDEVGARRMLRWMRVNSRFRFAKALGASFAVTP